MADRFNLTDEIDRMKAYEAKTAIPLPEPAIRLHGKRGKQISPELIAFFDDSQMHAHAAAVTAAARDCRTCHHLQNEMHYRLSCPKTDYCVNGNQHEPLPPVRLWRTT